MKAVLQALGVVLMLVALAAPLGIHLLKKWIEGRVAARVEEGLRKTLAEHQHHLDRELERHRQSLQLSAEAIRFEHQRNLHDFTLYAARRHQAMLDVYRALLEAEPEITDISRFVLPSIGPGVTEDLSEFLEFLGTSRQEREEFLAILDRSKEAAERRLLQFSDRARRKHAGEVRNRAYEAVHNNALFLSDSVEKAANDVLNALHMCLVSHLSPEQSLGYDIARHKLTLRVRVMDLKNAMRSELGRSSTTEDEATLTVHTKRTDPGTA